MTKEDEEAVPVESAGEEVEVEKVVAAEKGTNERFSINKVQVKPGKTLKNKQDVDYLTKLPVIPNKPAEYIPMPYTFRVPSTPAPVRINKVLARSPPHYMLLDHTIAVIWLLFAQKEYDCPLGIVQLQWAVSFLKTIKTRQGDYPKDVEVCIDAIEELLLDQYSELSNEMKTINKLDESVHYADGAFGSRTMVTKGLPFSLNYSEMIDKCVLESQVHHAVSITSTEAEEQLDKIKKTAGVASIENLESAAKGKAINILKMWKTDQVEKIKEELKTLRSIEERMKDIDDNFEGYIEDDMQVLLDD